MNISFDIHCDLPREGPGDDDATRKALERLRPLASQPRILDIGCGPGAQTMVLLEVTDGQVTALDNHLPYLEELRRRAHARDFDDRLVTVQASMFEMPFPRETFDVIWSEGALYIRGFEAALGDCLSLLKPGGAMAATECSWLVPDPPAEARSFWEAGYPAMRTVEQNLDTCRRAGFEVLDHFVLGPEAWAAYYGPVAKRLDMLESRYRDDPEKLAVLDEERREIDLYRRHGFSYGYVFYLLRRPVGGAMPTDTSR